MLSDSQINLILLLLSLTMVHVIDLSLKYLILIEYNLQMKYIEFDEMQKSINIFRWTKCEIERIEAFVK